MAKTLRASGTRIRKASKKVRRAAAAVAQAADLASPDDSVLCTGKCSFALLFGVPAFFGETLMELDFDADKKLSKKDWVR